MAERKPTAWLSRENRKAEYVVSIPKRSGGNDNGYYIFEPWHWRFVGVKLAANLHTDSKNFYDLDQREIDEYLINLFE